MVIDSRSIIRRLVPVEKVPSRAGRCLRLPDKNLLAPRWIVWVITRRPRSSVVATSGTLPPAPRGGSRRRRQGGTDLRQRCWPSLLCIRSPSPPLYPPRKPGGERILPTRFSEEPPFAVFRAGDYELTFMRLTPIPRLKSQIHAESSAEECRCLRYADSGLELESRFGASPHDVCQQPAHENRALSSGESTRAAKPG